MTLGANVAKYAGQYLWKRIISDERYKKEDYAAALKSAFLGCDADMKSRASLSLHIYPSKPVLKLLVFVSQILTLRATRLGAPQ